jgi:hypothetical protein
MSIKLDSVNYIVWKLQLTTILEAYSMIDHIDGSVQSQVNIWLMQMEVLLLEQSFFPFLEEER